MSDSLSLVEGVAFELLADDNALAGWIADRTAPASLVYARGANFSWAWRRLSGVYFEVAATQRFLDHLRALGLVTFCQRLRPAGAGCVRSCDYIVRRT